MDMLASVLLFGLVLSPVWCSSLDLSVSPDPWTVSSGASATAVGRVGGGNYSYYSVEELRAFRVVLKSR